MDGRIVGTVQYDVEDDALRIIGLGVTEAFRRQGVAQALVGRLADIARASGIPRLLAHTIEETGNVPIFGRLGFVAVRACEDEYSENDTYDRLTDVRLERIAWSEGGHVSEKGLRHE